MTSQSRPIEQAGVVPFRLNGDALEVCLISKTTGGWGIPKGIVEGGDTPAMTALREAWEEAGIRGRLLGESIGSYEYTKWSSRMRVAVYVMRVDTIEARWPEDTERERLWVSYDRALAMLRGQPVHALVVRAGPLLPGAN